MTSNPFSELGLADAITRAISAERYDIPTPIQERAVPPVLAGRDILAIAQTGTGKTAAFAWPLLQRLSEGDRKPAPRPGAPHALILAPTRELAIQIGDSLAAYGRHLRLRHAVIVGGVAQGPQRKAVAGGIDILVATPGRLLDLIDQGHLRLGSVGHLVLDEADRMLDMGFIRDVRKIVAKLPTRRQSLLFSATMPAPVEKLARDILADPVRIEVTPKVMTVEKIRQSVIHVGAADKRSALVSMLADPAFARVIVFTRTKHGANRVAQHLDKAGIAADAIHGNKSQNARQAALAKFRDGRARVLVATDIAARGIDVDDVTHVINFELPNVPESYVHRIGRTARAGAAGCAVSLCDADEIEDLRRIEKLTGRTLDVVGGTRPTPSRASSPVHAAPTPIRAEKPRRRRRGGRAA